MILPFFFFFFNDTATTEIYTLSLHDALPILRGVRIRARGGRSRIRVAQAPPRALARRRGDRDTAQGARPRRPLRVWRSALRTRVGTCRGLSGTALRAGRGGRWRDGGGLPPRR